MVFSRNIVYVSCVSLFSTVAFASSVTQIGDCNHLLNYLNSNHAGHVELKNDIDCSNTPWHPNQDNEHPFTGTFDGKGYAISHISFPPEAYQSGNPTKPIGFFNKIQNATIQNLRLFDVTIKIPAGGQSWQSEYAGGLVGIAYDSTIRHVSVVSANISMDSPADNRRSLGGIVGDAARVTIEYADFSGEVLGAPNTGAIAGHAAGSKLQNVYARKSHVKSARPSPGNGDRSNAGGLVGSLGGRDQPSTIDNCFYEGSVEAMSKDIGGIVGVLSNASISNCYANASMPQGGQGLVGSAEAHESIKNSYWDSSINNIKTSKGNGGEAKTTQEMVKKATYSGWDFENIWYIQEGVDYPILRR